MCEPIKFETLNSAAVVTLFLLYNVSEKTFTMNLFLALPRQQKKRARDAYNSLIQINFCKIFCVPKSRTSQQNELIRVFVQDNLNLIKQIRFDKQKTIYYDDVLLVTALHI